MPRLDEKFIAKSDEDRLIRAHGRLENTRILPKDMRNFIFVAQRPSTGDSPLVSPTPESRTLRLQELDA